MFELIKNYRQVAESYSFIKKYTSHEEEDKNNAFVIYLVASIASFVLSMMNLKDGYSMMMVSTLILGVGLLVSAILLKILKKRFVADLIAAIIVAATFSLYALTGANEGFAILWIIVLPPVLTNISRGIGIATSIYFLIFVYVICYTPIRNTLPPTYSKTFLERFPLLCTLDFFVTIYVLVLLSYSEKKITVKSYTDELTGLYNRSFYNAVCDSIEKKKDKKDIVLLSVDINNLKTVNDVEGHLAGDALIIGTSSIIKELSDKTIAACRIGGDEFVLIIRCKDVEIPAIESRLIELQNNCKNKRISKLSVSYGFASCNEFPGKTIEQVYNIADERMYENKTKYYLDNKIDRRRAQRRGVERRKKDLLND